MGLFDGIYSGLNRSGRKNVAQRFIEAISLGGWAKTIAIAIIMIAVVAEINSSSN